MTQGGEGSILWCSHNSSWDMSVLRMCGMSPDFNTYIPLVQGKRPWHGLGEILWTETFGYFLHIQKRDLRKLKKHFDSERRNQPRQLLYPTKRKNEAVPDKSTEAAPDKSTKAAQDMATETNAETLDHAWGLWIAHYEALGKKPPSLHKDRT